jgi:hypothetical protein
VSSVRKLVPSTRNIPMLNARKHVQDMDTRGNFPPGIRCQVTKEKNCKAGDYSRMHTIGLYNNKLKPTLGQKAQVVNMLCRYNLTQNLEALGVIWLEMF